MMVYLQKLDSIRPPLLLTNSGRQSCNNCHPACLNQSCSHLCWRRELDWSGSQKGMVANSCQYGNSPADPIKGRKFLDYLCTYWPLKDSASRSEWVSWGNESVSSVFHDNAILWVVHSFNTVQQYHHVEKCHAYELLGRGVVSGVQNDALAPPCCFDS